MEPVKEAKQMMEESIEHFIKELKNLRSGRASPGMIEDVMVEVYGTQMTIKSLGTISVSDGRQLVVTPFDPQTVSSIAKGIEVANLNLQAIADGNIVRIPVPPLSEDVRKDIVKQGKRKVEETKISIREVRRKANDHIKKMKSDGDITEDQVKKMEKEIQRLTDEYCKQVDARFSEKEKELMTV